MLIYNNALVPDREPIFISGLLHKPIRNNMRRSWSYLFTILALIAMSICSACVLQPQQSPTPVQNISLPVTTLPVNIGLREIPESQVPTSVSLERARQMLGENENEGDQVNISSQEIFFVKGRNLDLKGNAKSWLFGTRSSWGNQLQVYDRNRWTAIPWNVTFPSEAIQFDRILLPEDLINQNSNEIAGTAGSNGIREIELKNGIYLLTITAGSSDRILAFNATTGVLIA